MALLPAIPSDNGDCDYSEADQARLPFPNLGDFLLSYGNFGHGRSNAFQAQFERRYTHGLMFNISYTYLDQRSTGLDTGNSSLGGIAYNRTRAEPRLRTGIVCSQESYRCLRRV